MSRSTPALDRWPTRRQLVDHQQRATPVAGVGGHLPGAVVDDLDVDVPGARAFEVVAELAGFAAAVGVLDGVGRGLAEAELQVVELLLGEGRGAALRRPPAAERPVPGPSMMTA